MMNGPMSGLMMVGCGLGALLAIAIVVLGAAALISYVRRPA